MAVTYLDAEKYSLMLREGAARLNAGRKEINDLNVFPIPDGDTGDNMYMTVSAGSEAGSGASLAERAQAAAGGMLLGARGNSGVILSRIFAGLSRGLEGLSQATLEDFRRAMDCAVEEAYGAVSQPVEGTILTVLREGAAAAAGASFEEYFGSLCEAMSKSLDNTPELLPVLKEAGVVDSGGAGLLRIFQGMADALAGKVSAETGPAEGPSAPAVDLNTFGPDSELEFGYCTEFLLRLQNSKVNLDTFDETIIKDWLCSVGESVVCFRDGSIIKAHVHTRKPGDILNHCQQWGEFLTIKVENMSLQHSSAEGAAGAAGEKPAAKTVRKRCGIVTVASGAGLQDMFREFGADDVLEGGQTMNPSVESFLEAFDRVNADVIYVLPNNSNILLTAGQAAGLYKGSEVRVVHTRNLGAGIVVLGATDFGAIGPEDLPELDSLADSVVCAMVSRAIRDTAETRAGEYIGFAGSDILCSCAKRDDAVRGLLEKLGCGGYDVAMVVAGAEAPPEEAEALLCSLQTTWPRTEFILRDGGQAIYDYLIILQ